MKTKRQRPYRADCTRALEEIDAKRQALGITVDALCRQADVRPRTWWRMRASGLGFARRIRALKFALRTIEEKRRAAAEAFPGQDGRVRP